MIKMKHLRERGEIATILTLGVLVVIGVSAMVSSLFLNQKKTTGSQAAVTCDDPKWACGPECASQEVRNVYSQNSDKWRAEAGKIYGGCDKENQPIPPTPSCPGKYDDNGSCNPACCNSDSQCSDGQKCNIPNGFCKSTTSCNPNKEAKFHTTCVGGACVKQACPDTGTCVDDCSSCSGGSTGSSGSTEYDPNNLNNCRGAGDTWVKVNEVKGGKRCCAAKYNPKNDTWAWATWSETDKCKDGMPVPAGTSSSSQSTAPETGCINMGEGQQGSLECENTCRTDSNTVQANYSCKYTGGGNNKQAWCCPPGANSTKPDQTVTVPQKFLDAVSGCHEFSSDEVCKIGCEKKDKYISTDTPWSCVEKWCCPKDGIVNSPTPTPKAQAPMIGDPKTEASVNCPGGDGKPKLDNGKSICFGTPGVTYTCTEGKQIETSCGTLGCDSKNISCNMGGIANTGPINLCMRTTCGNMCKQAYNGTISQNSGDVISFSGSQNLSTYYEGGNCTGTIISNRGIRCGCIIPSPTPTPWQYNVYNKINVRVKNDCAKPFTITNWTPFLSGYWIPLNITVGGGLTSNPIDITNSGSIPCKSNAIMHRTCIRDPAGDCTHYFGGIDCTKSGELIIETGDWCG